MSRRYIFIAASVLFIVGALAASPAFGASDSNLPPHRDGVVLLRFQPTVPVAVQNTILAAVGAGLLKNIGGGVFVLNVGSGRVADALLAFQPFSEVLFSEPDYQTRASADVAGPLAAEGKQSIALPAITTASATGALPTDTFIGSQWAVQNTGQTVNSTAGTAGADERSLAAWSLTTGVPSVVVAVLDTGVQYSHPDLLTNLWNNPGGIGGCAAGTHGYNVLTSVCDPLDDDNVYSGHGSHVAGILGAVGNNSAGVAGVNWTTSVMALKWVDNSGNAFTSDLITAMDWIINAKKAGVNVKVANDSQSFFGTAFSQALSDEIDLLTTNDILFVTAAGNTAMNNDVTPRYPCSYNRPGMLCVAASDQNDNLWSSSNWGPVSVQLAAPGVNINSTLRSSNYGYISGGSMAAAQVSGAAALVLSRGNLTVANLRSAILTNVDTLASLTNKVATGGRLNVCKAVPGCSTATTGMPVNTVLPVVTGTPQQGSILGAGTGIWSGAPTAYTYQWFRCNSSGANCSAIPGATQQSYGVLASADTGATLAVQVTATNSSGSASALSAASLVVSSATSAFSIGSTIIDGQTIGGALVWQSNPGQAISFAQFYVDGALSQTVATSPYTYNQSTTGKFDSTLLANGSHVLGIRALSSADNRTYGFYGATVTVQNPPQNTALPQISGSATQGQILTTSNGSWTNNPTSFAWQWNRCNAMGNNCVAISGATASSYTIVAADVGSTLQSVVTATNAIGSNSAGSAFTAVVTGPVSVSTTSLPSGNQNSPYSATLAATGGTTPYTWSITSGTLPTGLSLAAATGVISGTPTATGTSSFTVQVKDNNAQTATQALSIVVNGPSPTITTTTLPGGTQNVAYTATVTATGGATPYTWSISAGALPVGLSLAAATGVISGTPTTPGTSNFTVQVKDNAAQTASKALSIVINPPPTITTASLPGGTQNTAYTATLAATGGTTPYTWSITAGTLPTGLTLAAATGVISGTPTVSGTSNFTVQVRDANAQTASKALSIVINAAVAVGYVQSAQNNPGGTSGTTATVALTGTVAGHLLVVAINNGDDVVSTVHDTQNNTFARATSLRVGNQDVELWYAMNIAGGNDTVTITGGPNTGYIWAAVTEYSGVATSGALDQVASASGTGQSASSGNTPTTTQASELVVGVADWYSCTGGTVPAAGSGYTGRQSANCGANSDESVMEDKVVAATGAYSVTATGANSSDTTWIALAATFKASGAPAPPTITTTSLPGGTQNVAYTATLAATGGATPYTWSITAGTLPTGLTLAAATGVISGTPTATGTSNFTVQVRDNNAQTATQALSIVIGTAPTITTTTLPAGTQNTAYTATLAATGGVTPYTWSITTGTLPAGLSLAAATGVISGTPTATGTSNFTVQVRDNNSQTATQALSIVVNGPGPTITSTSLPSGTQNAAYSATLTATGGATPYTWSITVGTLPAGLSLAGATGVISGTPTATGTSNFTVQVKDNNAQTATQALSIVVNPPPSITTASLPGGTQNATYNAMLTATGGATPYTWSITVGTLPTGLTLAAATGVISGTPTASGTSNFTVQVRDNNAQTASKALSIVINAAVAAGYVQSAQNNPAGTSGSTTTVALNGTVAGHLLIVAINNGDDVVSTVHDTQNNTFARATSLRVGNQDIELWYAMNIAGGNDTVTVTGGPNTGYIWTAATEYSGIAASGALDKVASASGSGQSASSGNTPTTTQANELVVGVADWYSCNPNTVPVAGSGYTGRQSASCNANSDETVAEDKVVAATGVYSATATGARTSDSTWIALVATFKSAVGP